MLRRIGIVSSLVAVILGSTLAVAAYAAPPPSGPATLVSEDFETPGSTQFTVSAPAFADPPSSAVWGRMTQRHLSGQYGLWCAGSVPSAWSVYPDATAGEAIFSAPWLADYYSSSVSFSYLEPSRGAADDYAFAIVWGPSGIRSDFFSDFPLTSATTWLRHAIDLSSPANMSNLSRTAADIRFQFLDRAEGENGVGANAEGPTVDDVTISGYKYGPVRALTASRVGNAVHLAWTKPAESTKTTANDARTLTYRVWRSENVLPFAWTELTSTRQSSTTFDDSGLEATKAYRYFVQAWDTGEGTGYGEGVPGATQGSGLAAVPAVGATPVARIAGADRIATALLGSKAGFPLGAPAVVIASGSSWTDALPASALAGSLHGPLLLTRATSLDASLTAEINRLGPSKIYIVGNTTTINSTVRTGLKAMGKSVVEVGGAGSDAYTMGQLIAAQVKTLRGGTKGGTVYVARSDVFADALAASSLAAAQKAPIILVPKTGTIPAAAKTALQNIGPATVVICGSSTAVLPDVEAQLKTITGKTPIRKGGTNRFDTAKLLIDYGTPLLAPAGPDGIYLATGWNFPDALAGGVLAGASADGKWRPLMTTDKLALSPQAAAYMDAHHTIKWARVLGSDYDPITKNGAVDDAVVSAIGAHLY